MFEKDFETARVMDAKEDGVIFTETDEYLALNGIKLIKTNFLQ